MNEPVNNTPEYSVSEIASALKRTVETAFGQVRVRGELSGFRRQSSGHWYGSLKDERALIDLAMWRGPAASLSFRPEDGLEVIVTGKLTTYPGRSKYQLIVESMEPAGVGALLAQIEARRLKLQAEGLFDPARKKQLPWLPGTIGVVTSPTGAVIRDILHRLADRFPRRVLVWPVAVQGEGSAAQVANAIAGFNAIAPGGPIPRPDLIIVARGGGSIEDLAAFNEENVVRAAAASQIPLISAVGHETDTTLIDFASDWRAPTPTAAAERAVPVRAELTASLAMLAGRLDDAVVRGWKLRRERSIGLARRLPQPRNLIGMAAQRIDDLAERLPNALSARTAQISLRLTTASARLRPELLTVRATRSAERLASASARLVPALARPLNADSQKLARIGAGLRPFLIESRLAAASARLGQAGRMLASLGPEQVLSRGYALVIGPDGHVVASASAAAAHASLTIRFGDGETPVFTKPASPQGSLF
ncbi:exodeoxyribonuclease VII large subunit [Sandarakinorhabdus sp. AAP62]|uniref:exodeoxyribonuclease VII large subunit n=1 Tax=Sandarakinorhabdus sp. AAP62 TaxID=1248916 RepID=UPI00031E448D|nr:exodeoxyribonuclease VII large subunit [Sandarakinorhabdus sp. AAP62]